MLKKRVRVNLQTRVSKARFIGSITRKGGNIGLFGMYQIPTPLMHHLSATPLRERPTSKSFTSLARRNY